MSKMEKSIIIFTIKKGFFLALKQYLSVENDQTHQFIVGHAKKPKKNISKMQFLL